MSSNINFHTHKSSSLTSITFSFRGDQREGGLDDKKKLVFSYLDRLFVCCFRQYFTYSLLAGRGLSFDQVQLTDEASLILSLVSASMVTRTIASHSVVNPGVSKPMM